MKRFTLDNPTYNILRYIKKCAIMTQIAMLFVFIFEQNIEQST